MNVLYTDGIVQGLFLIYIDLKPLSKNENQNF